MKKKTKFVHVVMELDGDKYETSYCDPVGVFEKKKDAVGHIESYSGIKKISKNRWRNKDSIFYFKKFKLR